MVLATDEEARRLAKNTGIMANEKNPFELEGAAAGQPFAVDESQQQGRRLFKNLGGRLDGLRRAPQKDGEVSL
jgi:hypothetical protein